MMELAQEQQRPHTRRDKQRRGGRGEEEGKRYQATEGNVVIPPIGWEVMMRKQGSGGRVHGENGMRQIALSFLVADG